MFGRGFVCAVMASVMVSGCSNPLDQLPKLSDLNVAETEPVVDAVAQSDAEIDRQGLFKSLWKKPEDPVTTALNSAEASIETATSSEQLQPDAGIKQADEDTPLVTVLMAGDTVSDTTTEPDKPRGLFARMGAVLAPTPSQPVSEPDVIAETDTPAEPLVTLISDDDPEVATENAETPEALAIEVAESTERSGFWHFGARAKQDVASDADEETVQLASAGVVATPRRGWFKPKEEVRTGPDAQLVSYGDTLPYGRIATVCGLSKSQLGQKVDQYPERGSGYTLYDSNPAAGGLRTHYLTGFKDGCARQFTSALAIFGSVETHQTVRYKKSNSDLPYSNSDTAFEKVKASVCKVGKGKPCSENGTDKLDKTMVFVSVYERFGTNPRWADILLYKGSVLAKDFKGR